MGNKMLSIKKVMNEINKTYFLPDIQRDYRWDEDRVISLFDSLMKNYPIGTLLIWKHKVADYNDASKCSYYFYKHIEKAKKNDNSGERLEKPYSTSDKKNIYAVLDGQQRLTALYLALSGNGGYEIWKGRGRKPRKTPPLRELYFSPAGRNKKYEENNNEFAFFNREDAPNGWYLVKELFAAKTADDFIAEKKIAKAPEKRQIRDLHKLLTEKKVLSVFEMPLNYSADDAVALFVKMNSAGVPLKRMELLFALAINNWQDGRQQIEDYLKSVHTSSSTYGEWSAIDKDFMLKTCLYLVDESISLSATKLRNVSFDEIKSNWDKISESLSVTLKLLDDYGHGSATIKSSNAILPIVYYCYNNDNKFSNSAVKKELNKLFIISQINNLFSSSTDSVLIEMRETMRIFNKRPFVFEEYANAYGNGKILECDKKTIARWVYGDKRIEQLKKGEDTLLLLSSLPEYIDKGNYYYEQDHLHPKKTFNKSRRNRLEKLGYTDEKIDELYDLVDCIGNLQLCKDRKNQNKSGKPLDEWINEDSSRSFKYDPKDNIEKKRKYFIKGDNVYDIKYYELFIKERSELIKTALIELLCN